MKIAVMTSGILPVPAVKGGAVENLIDFYLEYNDRHHLHDITVYSVADKRLKGHEALRSQVNHYRYTEMESLLAKVRKVLFYRKYGNGYYHYNIDYFLHEVLRDIRRRSYDTIIVENRPGFILKLREATTATCLLHLHNDFLNRDTQDAASIAAGYDGIICVSDYITQRVRELCSDNDRCVTVHNAIDTARFYAAQPADRKAYGLKADDFVIVYSGRLTEEKGLLPLVEAIRQLSDMPQLKLLIIGASTYGPDEQPTAYMQQIQQAAQPVSSQLVFTGFVDYDRVPSLLKMADMAVVPSLWEEPFGLTVVEAMAAGLPLVTTRCGGIPEVCEGAAVIVDREALADRLATAIRTLYHDAAQRQQLSAAALERSRQFDKDSYAKRFFKEVKSEI